MSTSYAPPPGLCVQLPLLIDTLIVQVMHWLEVEHFKLFTLGWLEQMQRQIHARLIRSKAAHTKTIDYSITGAVVSGLGEGLIATSRIAFQVLVDAKNFLAIGLSERTVCARWLWGARGIVARRVR
jgi:hypothetical protein